MEGFASLELEMLVPLVAVLSVEHHQPIVFSNVTLVKLLQKENTYLPILVTLSGMVTLVKLLQDSNAEEPILVTLLPMVTRVKLLQL